MRGCEWDAPEQSRGGARLFGPFHKSVCRGLLSNGPSPIDQLRKPSPAESDLRGVDSPMKFSHPAHETEHGGRDRGASDAQGLCHLRKFVLINSSSGHADAGWTWRWRKLCQSWDDQAFDSKTSVHVLRDLLGRKLGRPARK